jgi:hypothetical protein
MKYFYPYFFTFIHIQSIDVKILVKCMLLLYLRKNGLVVSFLLFPQRGCEVKPILSKA